MYSWYVKYVSAALTVSKLTGSFLIGFCMYIHSCPIHVDHSCPWMRFTQFRIHTRMYFLYVIICLLVYVRYKILFNAIVINFAPLHQLLFSIFSHAHPEANGRLPICEGINNIIYFILHYCVFCLFSFFFFHLFHRFTLLAHFWVFLFLLAIALCFRNFFLRFNVFSVYLSGV